MEVWVGVVEGESPPGFVVKFLDDVEEIGVGEEGFFEAVEFAVPRADEAPGFADALFSEGVLEVWVTEGDEPVVAVGCNVGG